jgi:hypothetical protein
MQLDDQYMERTPDLVAKIRKMRAVAERQMNRFTHLADYDARRVVGQKSKATPVSGETVLSSAAGDRPKRSAAKSATAQTSIEFAPAPPERAESEKNA